MQVKWLNTALQNLDDEAEYIAKDDPAAARLIVQRLSTQLTCYPRTLRLAIPAVFSAPVS